MFEEDDRNWKHISFLAGASSDEVLEWMAGDERFFSGYLGREGRSFEEWVRLLVQTDPAVQEKVKKALAKSISTWNQQTQSTEVLSDLIYVVGLMQNERALPELIRIVDGGAFLAQDEESQLIFGGAVASVSVFVHNEEAKSALARWCADESFDPRYTELICLGLIAGEPNECETLLPKLLKAIENYPENFPSLGVTVSELADLVDPDELEMILNKINTPTARLLLDQLPIAREILAESYPEVYRKVGE